MSNKRIPPVTSPSDVPPYRGQKPSSPPRPQRIHEITPTSPGKQPVAEGKKPTPPPKPPVTRPNPDKPRK